jgi:hypothetical protein
MSSGDEKSKYHPNPYLDFGDQEFRHYSAAVVFPERDFRALGSAVGDGMMS